MVSIKHEQMLQAAIKNMQQQGFRVIRLDKRKVPDAIAFKETEVLAIEADTNPTSVWLTRRAFENGTSQYDAEVIVTKPYSNHYHTKEEYFFALSLRKEGKSYQEMSRLLEEKFGRKFCLSLLYSWCSFKKKPLHI